MVRLLPPERDIGVLRAPVRACLALTATFLLALFGVGLLERIGLAPDAALIGVVGAAFALFLLAGVIAHSRRAADFYVADRKVAGAFGGLAGAAGLGGLLAIGIIGGSYPSGTDFLASAGGLTLGYVILAGVGPRLRRFGAYTPGDFVAARFGGILPRLVWGLISFPVSMLVLLAHLKIAGPLIATLLRVTPERALYAATVLTAMITLPGGMRSLTWTQAIQYFVIALACIVPAGFLVLASSGADTALAQNFGALFMAHMPPWQSLATLQYLAPALLAAMGAASLPHLLARTLTTRSAREAGTSMIWAVLFGALLIAAALFLAGLLSEAAPQPVGGDIPSFAVILKALPAVFAGLVVAGAGAALFALGEAALFSAAAVISHDIYDEILDRRAPEGRRIVVARLIIVGVAAGAAALAPRCQASAPELLQWAMALAAAGSFAPLLMGIWWRRCNEIGALSGMVAGFGFAGLIFLMAERIIPAAMVTSDWAEVSAPAAGIAGTMISFVVTIGLSLATPASKVDARATTVDAAAVRRQPPIRERPA